jgi:hypothetical protein
MNSAPNLCHPKLSTYPNTAILGVYVETGILTQNGQIFGENRAGIKAIFLFLQNNIYKT